MAQGLGDRPEVKDFQDKKTSTRDGRVVGSRRIFAPQFKLQVLDSYRHDADCRGNQRATARKYGIHRRQIQKWLQAEASLRTSVAPTETALNLSPARQRDAEVPRPPPDSDDDDDDDTDDDDIDILSVQEPDQALDFTCAALSKRRSFSLQFKLQVLDAFHTDRMCHGNQRATARKFGINRRQVQKWLGQEVELRGEAAFRGGMYRQRLGRWIDGDDQCWDLSSRKRKVECDDVTCIKRSRVEDVQETALCLKVESKPDPPAPLYAPVPCTQPCCCMLAVYHGFVPSFDLAPPHMFR